MRSVAALIVLAAQLFMFTTNASAASITLDFESLTDSTAVTNQFPDLIFSNTISYVTGVNLNQLETPPHSGTVAVSDDSGPIVLSFTNPVFSVGGFFTYFTNLTLQAFDSSNLLLGQVSSAFGTNALASGEPGSSPNEFLQLAIATGGISSLTITGDPTGGSFVLDDLTFDTGGSSASPVPEPATLSLLVAGLAAGIRRRRNARRNTRKPPRH